MVDWDRRWKGRVEDPVKDRLQGGITNTKDLLTKAIWKPATT